MTARFMPKSGPNSDLSESEAAEKILPKTKIVKSNMTNVSKKGSIKGEE